MAMLDLAVAGGHELQPLPDATLVAWNPQTYVITRTSEHADAWSKFKARVEHVRNLLPDTKVVQRHQTSADGRPDDQRSSRYTAKQIADLLFQYHIPGTLLMPDNEAGSDKAEPLVFARTVAVWVALVERASREGIPLAIGCMPDGNPDYPQYDLYAPLLAAMRDGARQNGVVHWIYTNAYYDPRRNGDPRFGDVWVDHLGRHQRELRRVAKSTGVPMPPMMIGELGIAWDYRSDMGFRADERMGYADYAGEITDKIAPRLDVPFNLFGIGDGIYDTRWRTFNVDHPDFWTAFLARVRRVDALTNKRLEVLYLSTCAGGTSVPPAPALPAPDDPRWRAGVAHPTSDYVNLRTEPSTSGGGKTVVGQLHDGDRCVYVDEVRAGADGAWMPVHMGVLTGWVSAPHAGIVPYESAVTLTLPADPAALAALHVVFEQLERATKG